MKNQNDARPSGKQKHHQQPQQQCRAQHPYGAPKARASIRSASGRRRFPMTKAAPRRFGRRTMTAATHTAKSAAMSAARPATARSAAAGSAAMGHHAIATHTRLAPPFVVLLYYNRCRRILQSMQLKSRLRFSKNSPVICPDKRHFLSACSVSNNVRSVKVLF